MHINLEELEESLRQSFVDRRLSGDEKSILRGAAQQCNEEQLRFMRNRIFDIYREHIHATENIQDIRFAYKWLERSVKTLDTLIPNWPSPNVYFSPGEACLNAIVDQCHIARRSLDVCVFTISDNTLAQQLVLAHQRGVLVRVISDDEKSTDRGSDIPLLIQTGVPVRMDSDKAHMHHKFAVVDGSTLINGSFNWTRSASERNQENILISHDPRAVLPYSEKFEQLWNQFSGC